jgi:hypothetical protein
MSLQISGEIIAIADTQSFASGFRKREFVVRTAEKYPQEIKLEAVKDGCDKLDSYSLGDMINVDFNIRGSEYNGKRYVSLAAWKIEKTN